MKGSIICCLAELVQQRFGEEQWRAIREDVGAGNPPGMRLATADLDDAIALKLLDSTCAILKLSLQQVADAFGEHWCCHYAPRVYMSYVRRFKNAREMTLGMDSVHVDVTQNIPNARPPRFAYHWQDEHTLLVTYRSERQLIDLYVGLARGVGTYFKEKIAVQRISDSQCRIRFSSLPPAAPPASA